MLNRKLPVLSIIFLALISNLSFAQTREIKQIDTLLKWSNKIGIFNGNILVAKDDKIIYSASFGYADACKKIKLTPAYRFNIGSISKEFSAVAIMMLNEEGKLKLNDKVSAYIPGLPAWAGQVTIKNLIEYTSGLPDLNWNTIQSDKDVLEDLRKIDSLPFKPGTSFRYTNNNVLLRQFIVEKITGLSFNEYVERFIYKLCKMHASVVNPPEKAKKIAKSFTDDWVQDPQTIPVSGVVFVTAGDLYKWTQCLHSGKIISNQSIAILGNSFRKSNGGLGATTFENDKLVLHQHDGQSRNFEALMYSDLKEDLTIILLGNNKNFKLPDIATAVKNILNGKQYKLPKKSLVHLLENKLDSLKVDDFISLYKTLKITRSNELDFENEDDLNSMAYSLLNQKRTDDAIKLFDLNCQQFPASANAFDSLGEAWYIKGDFKQAIINYKRSLQLDSKNTNAKQMIEKLEKAN
jgi:CubicO group peptidase (beta-lactamase class C family)